MHVGQYESVTVCDQTVTFTWNPGYGRVRLTAARTDHQQERGDCEMYEGFAIDLDEADKAARYPTGSLPHAVELLRAPISSLTAHDDFTRRGRFDAADRLQAMYAGWCDVIAQRLERACEVMDANADALRQIIALYRRVDSRS
jgi:hypothetical protein